MPPHCDAIDGPVVKAARRALEEGDVNIILPYVKKDGEDEVHRAFERAAAVRGDGLEVRNLADLYFFETVVRVHRAGEGAPYTGLKPAGLDVGPVIPVAERAIESGSPDELISLLTDILRSELASRFRTAMELKASAGQGVADAREYVEAMLGLQVYSHSLYTAMRARPHGESAERHAD